MADLLECVIQIKALGETLEIAAGTRAGRGRPAAETERVSIWQRLADAERRYATALGLEEHAQPAAASEAAGESAARAAFAARRRAMLAFLNRCTAAQLADRIEWPGRRSTTVADLVAIMLANDTELLGERRQADLAREVCSPCPGSRIPNPGGLPDPE
jgi:hypothetical protein